MLLLTWSLPSSVLWIVTHLLGWAPLVVMAVIKESSSSFFSLSFLTKLSIALFANVSLSPPCRWHIKLWTMLRQASLLVGVLVIDILSIGGTVLASRPTIPASQWAGDYIQDKPKRKGKKKKDQTLQGRQLNVFCLDPRPYFSVLPLSYLNLLKWTGWKNSPTQTCFFPTNIKVGSFFLNKCVIFP